MTKSTVTRVFVGSLIAIAGGLVLLASGVVLGFANGAFIMRGPDVIGINASAFAWSTVGIAVLGVLVVIAGGLAQFVAWIGAVVNTSRLDDKTWFIVLLVLGLASFGFFAMIAYLIAGPDGSGRSARRTQHAAAA